MKPNLGNGIEGWFGTPPDVANAGLTQVGKSAGAVTFTHPVAETPLDDVGGSYEWSVDLENWHPSGTVGDITVTITAGAAVDGVVTVTADTTGSTVTPATLLVRAVATQDP